MTARGRSGERRQAEAAPRVGLLGRLGSGVIGNDASMESVLRYLRADHCDALVDAMCTGPERISGGYGIDAVPCFWYGKHSGHGSGVTAIALKMLGKMIDAFRTASWVRRHDVVIVPGTGALEASLPVSAFEFPYAMFLLGVSGRLFGTKVALVSVGAGAIQQPLTRMLLNAAARLAFYRSYRDDLSRQAMRQRGLDVSSDCVYADLAFALPVPSYEPADALAVGVGVMAYRGSNADRPQADEIYAAYIEGMQRFVRWLVDSGRTVRLTVGDTNGSDAAAVQEILADLRESRPDCPPSRIVAEPLVTFADTMREMAHADAVVATRFHNTVCALSLGKPTISVSYSPKHDALMADMGLPEFCLPAKWLDSGQLIEKFQELEGRSTQLRQTLLTRKAEKAQLVGEQFAALSASLFPPGKAAQTAALAA